MCDLPHCNDDATHYAYLRPVGLGPGGRPVSEPTRFELCHPHYHLALRLAADQLTMITRHGSIVRLVGGQQS